MLTNLLPKKTWGKKQVALYDKKQELTRALSELRLPKVIVPTFSLQAGNLGSKNVLSISNGSVGYTNVPLIENMSLSLAARDRVAIMGDNGSGKSTLIKAILADQSVITTGHWQRPKADDVGYLDQHYTTLSPERTVADTIADVAPDWSYAQIRRHLNDFLFSKNHEVTADVKQLSGGEKARLSLAQIAAKTPKLLILDEVTNNLDRQSRDHVTQVLKAYPGAMIVISHDVDFLKEIGMTDWYRIQDGLMSRVVQESL